MKSYDVRWTPSDGKSSHGLWSGELKKTHSRRDSEKYLSKYG